MITVAVALVAGCSSGPKRTKRQTPEEKKRAAIEQETELLEGLQARGCACADAACREAIDDELAAYYRVATLNNPLEEGVETWPSDLDARGSAALDRVYDCLMSNDVIPHSLGVIVVRKVEMLREAACTCDGPTCAEHIRTKTEEVTSGDAHVPVDEAAQAAIKKGLQELGACLTAVYARTNQEAAAKLEAVRKAACECKDAACAETVLGQAQDWVRLYANVKTTTEGLEKIAATSHEIQVCLANAREGE